MEGRGITVHDLYNMCDPNNDGEVNVIELSSNLGTISDEFYQKDCQAIHNFLDIDRNNVVKKKEFLEQFDRAERLKKMDEER